MITTIVLFRANLRLDDNPALAHAAARGKVVPLFILEDPPIDGTPGGASRWWLREALLDLDRGLRRLGADLVLRRGNAEAILLDLIRQSGASSVSWQRRHEPALALQDEALASRLRLDGVEVRQHEGFLLFDPAAIRTAGGSPFRVFTPFARACMAAAEPSPCVAAPRGLQGVAGLSSERIEDWRLVPAKASWPKGLAAAWQPVERTAHSLLSDFLDGVIDRYRDERDRPDMDGTSRLSPYLHFGQISPRRIWHQVRYAAARDGASAPSVERYLLEILWREFSWHLLAQFPELPHKPLIGSFEAFPWREDEKALEAWKRGRTGYPIVDAGMRQLWETGWMHNRVRMVVASFLVKHLLVDWRAGAEWFWDTLVDADLGNNYASWQWVAGCGADAAPFFRIFNPMLQGRKFDPRGDYVRRYVPELARLPADSIHEPWQASAIQLRDAGIRLGSTYPLPIVDHQAARQRALGAMARVKDPRSADLSSLPI